MAIIYLEIIQNMKNAVFQWKSPKSNPKTFSGYVSARIHNMHIHYMRIHYMYI